MEPPGQSESGNAQLGIDRFVTEDNAARTTVVGLDGQGNEVARMDLIHGRFALTGLFKADYAGTTHVDGRKLDVTLSGEKRLVWETEGYAPVLHMPAHPSNQQQVAAFLEDAHVKPVLDRWQIGFKPFTATVDGERGYTTGVEAGTGYTEFGPSDDSYGSPRPGLTAGTCGGGGISPTDAGVVVRTTGGGFSYNEWMIAQCCPDTDGGSVAWFARKSCPTTGSGAQPSSCGTTSASGACKGCPGYPPDDDNAFTNSCSVSSHASGMQYSFADQVIVTVSPSGHGTVTSSPAGISTSTSQTAYFTDSSITLSRTDSSYEWTGWTGNCTGTSNSCVLSISPNQAVTATYNLGGTISGAISPTSTLNPTSNSILDNAYGTGVTVTMFEASGYTFSHDGVCNSMWTTGSNTFTCDRGYRGTGYVTITHTASGATRILFFNFL